LQDQFRQNVVVMRAVAPPVAPEKSDDLSAYDQEEDDVRGNLTFKPVKVVLPKTKRTEELHKRKTEELRRKKDMAEKIRKEKEKEEAARRQEEQRAKKQAHMAAEKRREEAKKRQEEEEQRKKMEGGLEQILIALNKNMSAKHITVCGIELTSVRLRLLTQAMENNTSCMSLDVSRKGLGDEDGVPLADMLKNNKHLQKLELEGNNLGVNAAEAIGEALRENEGLRSLNLESNNLTANGSEQKGIIVLADALRDNGTLRVLMLSKNGISAQAGEHFVRCERANLFVLAGGIGFWKRSCAPCSEKRLIGTRGPSRATSL